ncbi:MAG: tetratricopeptide repeat protein [Caulobacteraceae bacterium]|nr:tetratricopeptide repeat protein [Caulobacteraceae bacterium]
MKQALRLAAAVFAASIVCPASAEAAVLVLGSGDAALCSRAALGDGAASNGVRACDAALRDDSLTARDRAATFVNRGVLELRSRDFDRAVRDFDAALRINPRLGEALVNRGAARVGQHRYADGLRDLERGTELGAAEPEKAWFNRGLAHEGLGDLQAAYRAYRRAAELRPDWDAPQRELARFTVRPAQ